MDGSGSQTSPIFFLGNKSTNDNQSHHGNYFRLKKVSLAGEFLEIFLRITSEKMLQVYGKNFMKLLVCLDKELIPRLPPETIGSQRINSVLNVILSSQGRDIPSIYEET